MIYFTIEAPLQSWGEYAKGDYRDTSEWPTKSGIVGMIGASLGISQEDKRIGEICESIDIGFKTKKEMAMQLSDFQTVDYLFGYLGNGTTQKDNDQRSITMDKQYLMDKKFLVVISGTDELMKEIEEGMRNPKYPMTLGRKCCVPSAPVIPHKINCESIEEALKSIPLYGEETCEVIQLESDFGERRMDERLAVRGKHYGERYVVVKDVD